MAGQDRFMNDFAPVTDASYIYAEAADRSQVKIRKNDLASIVGNEIGAMKRIPITSPLGGYNWVRIMEFHNEYSGSFILSLSSFANQPDSVMIGYAGVFDGRLVSVSIKQLIGSFGGNYQPNVKYKYVDNKVVIWALASVMYGHFIYILRGGATVYPMINEEPPSDASIPIP